MGKLVRGKSLLSEVYDFSTNGGQTMEYDAWLKLMQTQCSKSMVCPTCQGTGKHTGKIRQFIGSKCPVCHGAKVMKMEIDGDYLIVSEV